MRKVEIKSALDLEGQDLTGFSLKRMTEVMIGNSEAERHLSWGFLMDAEAEQAYAKGADEIGRYTHRPRSVMVLTNGEVAFALREDPVRAFDGNYHPPERKRKGRRRQRD